MFTGLKAVNHFGRPDMSSFLKFVQKKHSYVSYLILTVKKNNLIVTRCQKLVCSHAVQGRLRKVSCQHAMRSTRDESCLTLFIILKTLAKNVIFKCSKVIFPIIITHPYCVHHKLLLNAVIILIY